jgi:hypothetical protein
MPHENSLSPDNVVLLVVDVQEAFRDVVGSFSIIASNISRAVSGFTMLGLPLIVTEQTRRLAERNFGFLEVDSIPSPGDNRPIVLHALMGGVIVRASPKFRALAVFHDHIFQAIRSQNWRVARDLIAQCRRLSGANQALYDLHLARIAYYETHPPGADWDGAFRQILE